MGSPKLKDHLQRFKREGSPERIKRLYLEPLFLRVLKGLSINVFARKLRTLYLTLVTSRANAI